MPLPLITEVVKGSLMEVMDKATLQITIITPTEVMDVEVEIDKVKGKIPVQVRNLNVSYVVSLATLLKYVIIGFDISFQGGQTTTSPSLNNGNQNNILAMVASFSNSSANESWYLDSGASHHLTQNLGNLTSTSPYTGTDRVTIGNGKHLSISNIGSKQLHSHTHSFRLKKVFHVPFISANLISVAKLCSKNNALI